MSKVDNGVAERTLFGLENELALGVRDPADASKLPTVAAHIIPTLQRMTPSLPCSEGRGSPPGLMMMNGGRIYLDGRFFVENATGEVLWPEDILAYQRAGERLILKALPQAAQKAGLSSDDLCLTRAVTDYDGKYCGAHVNVLLRRHEATDLIDCLVPFLVSRLYACAGGWSSTGFVMSHKAASVCCVASEDTRHNRGIVNTKKESLAQPGYTRIHVTHGDALMSDWGTYLSVGCTALVLKMLDDGASVGTAMTLCARVEMALPSVSGGGALVAARLCALCYYVGHDVKLARAQLAAIPPEAFADVDLAFALAVLAFRMADYKYAEAVASHALEADPSRREVSSALETFRAFGGTSANLESIHIDLAAFEALPAVCGPGEAR